MIHEELLTETSRLCGPCNACCTGALRLKIEGQQIDRGRACHHCTSEGCNIYAQRPSVCRAFACGWLTTQSHLPEFMRPDQSGAIVLLNRLHWLGAPVDLAVAVERYIPAQTREWLIAYALQQRRPLVYQVDEEWEVIGTRELCEAIRRGIARGQRFW